MLLNLSWVVEAVTNKLFWFVILTQVIPIEPAAVWVPPAYKKYVVPAPVVPFAIVAMLPLKIE